MALTITPTNSETEYGEIRGNLAESACSLTWQAMKVYKVDDITCAIAGWLQTSLGIDVYPREKRLNYPELVVIKLRKGEYEVNGKNAQGDWIKVKRQPSQIERAFSTEVLTNFSQWKDQVFEGSILLNDALMPHSATPIGHNNNVWNFSPCFHGKVVEWSIPQGKDGYSKFVPKKSPLELYEETKTILQRELEAEHTIASLIKDLRTKFGDSEAAEVLNTVIYGILSK
jgi:hypothetical protein